MRRKTYMQMINRGESKLKHTATVLEQSISNIISGLVPSLPVRPMRDDDDVTTGTYSA